MADLMSLMATLSLDSSEYENGINRSKGLVSSLGGAITTAMKVGAAGIVAATGAVAAFAKSAVEVGASFDSSMSQVAATMGNVDDMSQESFDKLKQYATDMGVAFDDTTTATELSQEALRAFAQEMGATTAFSASQAADALNYMALAGYDATTSMDMLPNVLNLAAAGGMELATASDMVTDASSALGLSLDETSVLVDQMAKASSKSNTSVSQLGEAILTIGATARGVKGGTQELSTVLGVLADNGIKGAEGGTHLRNAILSLQTPTKDGAEALAKLGMSYADMYDEAGNLRSLPEIFQKMSGAMEGMTQQSKDAIVSGIFNKTDLAAMNALIGTSTDRWNELSAAIGDSAGAADAMAKTQLDNLNGDITYFKSALEGAQILLSDQLTPYLREFVQFGTESINTLSDAFKEGGLSGAMEALGDILSKGLGLIIDKIPVFVDAGVKLLSALGRGIISNIPLLLDAAGQIVSNLWKGIQENWAGSSNVLNELFTTLKDYITENGSSFIEEGYNFITNFINGFIEAIPDAVENFANVITGINDYIFEHLPEFTEKGFEIITNLATGIIENLPTIITAFGNIIANSISNILTYLPQFLEQGANFILNMVNGIGAHSNEIFSAITSVISNLISIIMTQLPNFLSKGIEIIMNLAQGILNNLPELLSAGTQSAVDLIAEIASHLPEFLEKGIELLGQVGAGLIQAIPDLIANIPVIISNIVDTFMSYDWLSIGVNIISGIGSGIMNAAGDLASAALDAVSNAWNAMTGWLGIASPSKKAKRVIGRNWALGIGEGFEENMPEDEMIGSVESTMKNMQNALTMEPLGIPVTSANENNGGNMMAALYGLLAQYLPQISANKDIYFNDGTWAGRLAPAVNEELGRIAEWEAAQ